MEKVITKKYYPVFSTFNVENKTVEQDVGGLGHDNMGDAFDEGIKHYFKHNFTGHEDDKGKEALRDDENKIKYIRQFNWTVREQYVWVGNKDSNARQYIGEEEE